MNREIKTKKYQRKIQKNTMSPNIYSISRNKQISKNKRMIVQVIMTLG